MPLAKFFDAYIVPENLTHLLVDRDGPRNLNEPRPCSLAHFGAGVAPYRVFPGRVADFLKLLDGSPGVELVEDGDALINLARVGHVSRVRANHPNRPVNREVLRVHFVGGGTLDFEHSEAAFLAKLDAHIEAQAEDGVEPLRVPATTTKGGPR